jgi:hypothetical protein
MADYRRTATGNWSTLAQWNEWNGSAWVAAVALPGAADRCFANNFTTTLDSPATITVAELNNSNSGPAGLTAGGTFTFGNTNTVNSNIRSGTVNTSTLQNTTGNNKNINGDVFGGIGNGTLSGSNIIYTGNATTTNLTAIRIGSNCIMTGNFSGGGGTTGIGILISGISNIINGNCFGGTSANGAGIFLDTGSNNNILNGNATGGTVGGTNASAGVLNFATGTITINGTVTGGTGAPGAQNASSGRINCTLAVASSTVAGIINPSAATAIVFQAQNATNGNQALSGFVRFSNTGPNIYIITRENGTTQTLVDSSIGNPATTDVRNGVTYASGALTGTLVVPSPSNVRQGVPTDNTVGTAALTPADFWDYLTSSATPGSMGARVAAIPTNPASVESTGAQIASYNT